MRRWNYTIGRYFAFIVLMSLLPLASMMVVVATAVQAAGATEPETRTVAVLRGYRGFLPLQGQRQTSLQAETGSLVDDFCTVYDGLCPASRRFALPASPARQLILHTDVTTSRHRRLSDRYALHTVAGIGRFHAARDDGHAHSVNGRVGLLTPTARPVRHSLYLNASALSSTTGNQTARRSVKTAIFGYQQQLKLPAELSSVLFGLDYLSLAVARGHHNTDSQTADTSHIRLVQLWDQGSSFVRLSTDWHRHDFPAGHLLGDYHHHTQQIGGGLNAASPFAVAGLLSFFHIQSVQFSYARSRTRFTRLLPWQAAAKDSLRTQTSLRLAGPALPANITPFVLLQAVSVKQSAFAPPGRHITISLGLAIQF